jgi:hypothetical protein
VKDIQHSGAFPRPDHVYRCPICRLQMRFDPALNKMRPLPPNGENGKKDKSRNVA